MRSAARRYSKEMDVRIGSKGDYGNVGQDAGMDNSLDPTRLRISNLRDI
jgi:hypothetical protein